MKDYTISPVIGVILMVAVTVILAAVIAAFVFGMYGYTPDETRIDQINVTERIYSYPENYIVDTEHGEMYSSAYPEFRNLTPGWHTVKVEVSHRYTLPRIVEVIQ